jgi:hypothetical protein
VRVDHALGKGGDVAQAEVESLAGDRMQHVRSIACKRQAQIGIAVCLKQRERIGPARPGDANCTERIAEAIGDLLRELRVAQGHHGRHEIVALRPHDRRAMFARFRIRQRQHRKRTRRQEALVRQAAMRPLVSDRSHDARLPVAPTHRADAGGLARRRLATVGSDHQPRADRAVVCECDRGS